MSQMSQWVRSVRIKVLVETIKFSFISFSEKSRGIQCSFIPWIVVDHEHTTEDDPGKTIYVLKRSNNQLQSCFQLITLIPNAVHHFFQSVLLAVVFVFLHFCHPQFSLVNKYFMNSQNYWFHTRECLYSQKYYSICAKFSTPHLFRIFLWKKITG